MKPAREYNSYIERIEEEIHDVLDVADPSDLHILIQQKVKKALDDLKMPESKE